MSIAARTASALTAAMACAALVPAAASATHQSGWQDGGAAVPATVDLEEVGAHGPSGVVVAVGRDTGTSTAVIRRRAAGTWVQDTISGLPMGASDTRLVDVAVQDGVAWAVGTYVNGPTNPLLLRATGGESALEGTTPATWAYVSPPMGLSVPRSVALFGSKGIIGTEDAGEGTVFPFDDAGPAFGAELSATPAAGPINAVTLHADGKGFTGGELQPGGGTDRIFAIDRDAAVPAARMVPAVTGPSDPDLPIAGIAAGTTEDDAIAVESNPGGAAPGFWAPSADVWGRNPVAFPADTSSNPADASATGAGVNLLQTAAGEHAGDGAVWRRSGAGAWNRDGSVSTEALNGVAVIGATDIWAVGDDGNVKHYSPLPDPPPPDTQIDSGPPNTTPDPMASFAFSSIPTGADFECSMDGSPFADCPSPKSYGPLSLGTHNFQVRARGENNSVDLTPASRSVTIVPPETTIGSGPSPTSDDTTPTFSFFSDFGSAGFECSVDGGAFFPCSSPTTLGELAEGQHGFQVRAVTAAGADPTPASSSFRVDLPDPVCIDVPRPLLRNVVVRKEAGVLVIEFELAAKARVRAKAFHGSELIGRTKEKVLKPGAHTLRLRWRGSAKPTRLKMAARPAAANACK